MELFLILWGTGLTLAWIAENWSEIRFKLGLRYETECTREACFVYWKLWGLKLFRLKVKHNHNILVGDFR